MSEVKHDANAKFDECVDLTVRRFVHSTVAVTFGGFLLFPVFMVASRGFRRAAMAFGAGIGIGSAYTECSQKFDTRSASSSQAPTSQVMYQPSPHEMFYLMAPVCCFASTTHLISLDDDI